MQFLGQNFLVDSKLWKIDDLPPVTVPSFVRSIVGNNDELTAYKPVTFHVANVLLRIGPF